MFVVGDIIRNNASQYPNKIGLVHGDDRFTWRETEARVNAFAQGMTNLGLKKGDGVGILMRNCHQWVETALALAKLGIRMVPLNIMLKENELTFIIQNAEVKYLVADTDRMGLVRKMWPELPDLIGVIGCHEGHDFDLDYETMVAENPDEDPWVPVTPGDIAMVIYTSGTTGRPKGAMLSHGNLSAVAVCEASDYRIIPAFVVMNFVPLFFIGGWGSTCLPFLIRSCTHHIMTFDAEKVLQTIQNEKINATVMVPTMINMLANHPEVKNYDYSSLRAVPFAGSALPVEVWRKAADIFGNVFVSCYGFTEGCGTVSVLQPEDVDPYGDEKAIRFLGSCGKPMVQTTMKLVGNGGKDIPWGSPDVGEICVKGPTIFQGYWKHEAATREVLKDGWFYTGDLATRDEEGFYYIVDRKKDMIISGGINVYPREIEEVIYLHPAVLECSVIGVPDEKWGETVKAVITLKPGFEVTAEEIIALCQEKLASYKKPTSVDFVESLPKTASGKILKRKLREEYWRGESRRL